MREVEFYLVKDWLCLEESFKDEPYKIMLLSENIDLWDNNLFKFNDGKLYRVVHSKGNKYEIEEVKYFNPKRKVSSNEIEITCPICNYEFCDSWEYEDSDEGFCPCCGADLEFDRVVEVSYITSVVEVQEPIDLSKFEEV